MTFVKNAKIQDNENINKDSKNNSNFRILESNKSHEEMNNLSKVEKYNEHSVEAEGSLEKMIAGKIG